MLIQMLADNHLKTNCCFDILAHAQHAINLLYSKPVKDVWHESLEAHILNTGDVFSSLEVLRCTICGALSGIIHKILTYVVSVGTRMAGDKHTFVTSPSALPSFLK